MANLIIMKILIIKIRRRDLIKDDLNLFIIIETGNNVMINRGSSSQLKLGLK